MYSGKNHAKKEIIRIGIIYIILRGIIYELHRSIQGTY